MLPIDITTATWFAIKEYAESRIESLTATCTSTSSSPEERLIAAHRIEELSDMLTVPGRAKRAAEYAKANQPTKVY